MSDRTPTGARPALRYAAALVVFTVAGAAGFWMSMTSPKLPGTEALTLEDAVDAVALLLFGVLGAALLVKGRATGLGRALLLTGGMIALDYLLSGFADAIAEGQPRPVAAARLLNIASEAAFVVAFFLLALAPLFLFPTGRLPSRRWRLVAGAAVLGCGVSVLSVLLTPGPVDEDVTAWGENPIGLHAVPGLMDALETAGMALLAVSLVAGLAAFVIRWLRYRGPRRQQMAWFTIGVVVQVTGLLTDNSGKPVVVEVLTALAIFAAMLWGIGWPLLGPLGSLADAPDHVTSAPAKSDQSTGKVSSL